MQSLLHKARHYLLPTRPRLQQYTSFTFPAAAPFLLLAGDIGRLVDYASYLVFLFAQTARFKRAFLVLGNHEFYGLFYSASLDAARKLSAEPSLGGGLVLLHRARWDDPDSDLTILGCTLWSSIPDASRPVVEAKVNDFKHITNWTAQRHTEIHDEERRVLGATHHAPCVEGLARPEQGREGRVRVWVFGYTRFSVRLKRGGVRVVANQRVYVFPRGEKGFDDGLVVVA
ncbi:hypothetical protein C8A05DRAFT_43946 [Staphylotrichum tortipilum]|uniref:Calcineurin-like phosphoesterase domain-containing protein n=1 Tax=Staphylotrichum tortipilum TaxID=2831512 RepID=A0AAN6RUL3_9PEZI|nr:hypothetical protein C8A05DRAFT_43946 [Staphylotrichum longicolle]